MKRRRVRRREMAELLCGCDKCVCACLLPCLLASLLAAAAAMRCDVSSQAKPQMARAREVKQAHILANSKSISARCTAPLSTLQNSVNCLLFVFVSHRDWRFLNTNSGRQLQFHFSKKAAGWELRAGCPSLLLLSASRHTRSKPLHHLLCFYTAVCGQQNSPRCGSASHCQ